MPRPRISRVEQRSDSDQDETDEGVTASDPQPPSDWIVGQLLNVRNTGSEYVMTLLDEEFDYRHPERALRFPNSSACQQFVSAWYARTYASLIAR